MTITLGLDVAIGFFGVLAVAGVVGMIRSKTMKFMNIFAGTAAASILITGILAILYVVDIKNANYEATYPGEWGMLKEFIDDTVDDSEAEIAGMDNFKAKFGCPSQLSRAGVRGMKDLMVAQDHFDKLFADCIVPVSSDYPWAVAE